MSEAALSMSQNAAASMPMSYGNNGNPGAFDANKLFEMYGTQNVLQAVSNVVGELLEAALGDMIDSMPMQQFMKDDAKNSMQEAIANMRSDVPQGAMEGVISQINQFGSNPATGGGSQAQGAGDNGAASAKKGGQASGGGGAGSAGAGAGGAAGGGSGAGSDPMSGIMDMVKSSMQDETNGATSAGGNSGGKGNWLAILARALGQTAGKALKEMVDLGKKMGSIDSKENPEAFAETQAEFQAQAQIFKMFQEAIATMVKGIGEGMAAVARKQ